MRTLVTKQKDKSRLGVNLDAVTIDEPISGGGTRLWFEGGLQLEVVESQDVLWPPPRNIAAELAAASDTAANERAAAAIADATKQAPETDPSMSVPVTPAAAQAAPPVPVAPVPGTAETAPVWVDPAIWERHAANAREAAAAARANAEQAAQQATAAQQTVNDFASQMTEALKAKGVTWDKPAAPAPAEPEPEPVTDPSPPKPAPKKAAAKKAAAKKPAKKAPTKGKRR